MSIRVMLGLLMLCQMPLAAAESDSPPLADRFSLEAGQRVVEPNAKAGGRFAISAQVNIQQGSLEYADGGRFTASAKLSGAAVPEGVCLPEIFKDGFEATTLPPPPNPIVRFDNVNFSFPATGAGGSINWATGETCACDSAPFNFNVYATNGIIRFFWPSSPTPGGVAVNEVYQVLAPGAVVGPGSTFSVGAGFGNTVNWAAGTTGFLGFRFVIPPSTQVNYGYARISTTGANGFPATLLSYAYDQTGNAITIPPL